MGFKSGEDHPFSTNLNEREKLLRKLNLGSRSIPVGAKIRRTSRSRQVILLRCNSCGLESDVDVSNLLAGKSTNCRCQGRRKYHGIPHDIVQKLGERYDAMVQRCRTNGQSAQKNYGERGIEVRCNREELIRFFWSKYSYDEIIEKQIDRIDNDGPYELGNMRLVTARENLLNRRNTVFAEFQGRVLAADEMHNLLAAADPRYNYARSYTKRLATRGMSGEAILRKNLVRRREKARKSFRRSRQAA